MFGSESFALLVRLVGRATATAYRSKFCDEAALDDEFYGDLTNADALAFYVYATASGWHSYINGQLWSGHPHPDVVGFSTFLNSALRKLPAIKGANATVFRGYDVSDLESFARRYAEGEVVRFPGFTSASFKEAGAFGGNVLFIIRALTARAIWFLSPTFHEEEALLPAGCTFEVIATEFQVVEDRSVKLVIILRETSQASP